MDILGFKYNNDTYYYQKNYQNDITGIYDSNYNLIVKYTYDAWGKILSVTDNNDNIIIDNNHIGIINPFRYRSYYYDEETKLYYLNSRYYNPLWGRFINADGIIGANQDILSLNLYIYASNDFINNVDSNGNIPWKTIRKKAKELTDAAVNFIADTTSKIVVYEVNKKKKELKDATNFVKSYVNSTINGYKQLANGLYQAGKIYVESKVKETYDRAMMFNVEVGVSNPSNSCVVSGGSYPIGYVEEDVLSLHKGKISLSTDKSILGGPFSYTNSIAKDVELTTSKNYSLSTKYLVVSNEGVFFGFDESMYAGGFGGHVKMGYYLKWDMLIN